MAAAARLRMLTVEERARRLVDRDAAERLFHESHEHVRKAWAAWTPRAAEALARELGVDPVVARAEIEQAVAKQLAEMPLARFEMRRTT
jgi:hypothetical protein